MPSKSDKIVVVFHADGCHHCHDYLPRFRRVAVKYRPFVAIKAVKLTEKNIELCDRYKIGGFPTTAILGPDETLIKKVEGAISEAEIEKIFKKAVEG